MQYLIAIVIGVALLFGSLAWFNDSASHRITAEANAYAARTRADAEAYATRTQADARAAPAYATATAITIAGLSIPLLIILIAGVAVVYIRRPQPPLPSTPPVIYILGDGTRRQLWNAISAGATSELLTAPHYTRGLVKIDN